MKKFLSIILTIALIASSMTMVFASNQTTYTDIGKHWAKDCINDWSEYGVIKGYDGKFSPDRSMTRGEFAVVIDRILKYQTAAENVFKDLKQDFYTDAILKLNQSQVMKGDGDTVRPNATITREESAVMLCRALGIAEESAINKSFSDTSKVSSWATGFINAMVNSGLLNGSDGKLNPKSPITRAEVVKILDNAVIPVLTSGELTNLNTNKIIVISSPNVVITNSALGGKIMITQGVTEGTVTFMNTRIKGEIAVDNARSDGFVRLNDCAVAKETISKLDKMDTVIQSGTTEDTSSEEIKEETKEESKEEDKKEDKDKNNNSGGGGGGGGGGGDNNTSTTVAVTGVTLNKSAEKITVGGKTTLTATVNPSNATNKNVTWSSSNTSVATVSNGTVTGVSVGTATITVKTSDGGKTATCTITVKAAPQVTVSVKGVSLNKNTGEIKIGQSLNLTATISPSNATNKAISWSSSDETVATVSNGTVNGISDGTATITVTTEDGGFTANCEVTVKKTPVTKISLNKTNLEIGIYISETIVATVVPSSATYTDVEWSSSDEGVAQVDYNGQVTAISEGTATITATTDNGDKSAECYVTVRDYYDENQEVVGNMEIARDDLEYIINHEDAPFSDDELSIFATGYLCIDEVLINYNSHSYLFDKKFFHKYYGDQIDDAKRVYLGIEDKDTFIENVGIWTNNIETIKWFIEVFEIEELEGLL